MKKISITVNGAIGAGKTTFINNLTTELKNRNKNVLLQPEPSVTLPKINETLQNFYNDGSWAYTLQLMISAAQEFYIQEAKKSNCDISIMDAALSSAIYGYSHFKNGRITQKEFHTLESINSDFYFDYLFWLDPGLERIKENVLERNKKANAKVLTAKDLEIDLSYLDSHYQDFQEYKPIYFAQFQAFNPNIKIIELDKDLLADFKDENGKERYDLTIEVIVDNIIRENFQ